MALFKSKKSKVLRPTSDIICDDAVLNAAETLMANIHFSNVDNPVKTITVTSSIPNEGKTTTAVALATAICRSGKGCVVIEGDLRRRSLASVLEVHPRHGLYAVLSGEASLDSALVKVSEGGLMFLDAEAGIPSPEGILNSKAFSQLLESLKERFDYVIVDTPPMTTFADAAFCAARTDGTLLVVRERFVSAKEAAYSKELLDNAGANIIGIVMNGMRSDSGNGAYGYYYSYYNEEVPASAAPSANTADRA